MTDQSVDLDEFIDEAQDEFPAKEDFEDRLVAIWPTGKQGTRKGESGKDYNWVETFTLALDNGPDGTAGTGNRSDKSPFLVGPAPSGTTFQWSAVGVYSRVAPRITAKMADGSPNYKPVLGRINRRKNAKKGLADSWSLGSPTEADKVTAREYISEIKKITEEMKLQREHAADASAFDE